MVGRLVLGILVGNTWGAMGGDRSWVAQHNMLMDGSIRNGLRVWLVGCCHRGRGVGLWGAAGWTADVHMGLLV